MAGAHDYQNGWKIERGWAGLQAFDLGREDTLRRLSLGWWVLFGVGWVWGEFRRLGQPASMEHHSRTQTGAQPWGGLTGTTISTEATGNVWNCLKGKEHLFVLFFGLLNSDTDTRALSVVWGNPNTQGSLLVMSCICEQRRGKWPHPKGRARDSTPPQW
jgi:hypothetical protein